MKVILEAQHAVGHPQLRGVGYYSLELIRALLKRKKFDYELTLFDYNKEMGNVERAHEYFGEYNVPIHECNDLDYRIASRDESVFSQRSYNDYTNTNGDIYHFMCPVSVPTNLKGNMIVTVHDVIWEAQPGMIPLHTEVLHKTALERITRINPFIIADSYATKKDILSFTNIPNDNISVIYPSYDEENMYPDNSEVSDIVKGPYFLFVGAFERRKNIAGIINAFSIVAEKNKDIKLVIAGKKVWDDTADMDNAYSTCKYKDRIVFVGYIDVSIKRKLYSNASAFVFPSFYEGFGIPVLEAMACGCPVITANNSSLLEVGGDAAIYVDAYDKEHLSYEMERILFNDSLKNELIIKGNLHKNDFSWNITVSKLEKIYSELGES